MRIWVFGHMRNEARLLPFWLRHYAAFADQIHVYDDNSTDGSPELVAQHDKAFFHNAGVQGLKEDELLNLAYRVYPTARGSADFVIWTDIDEFIFHPRIKEALAWHKENGHDVVRTLGFNMMGTPLPENDGTTQLTDIYRTGVRAPVYSKSVIFNPDIDIRWSLGKHFVYEKGVRVSPIEDEYAHSPHRPKLLHYRYLTPEYCRERNARQYERSVDKGAAWSNSPDHRGEHSPEWVERTMYFARDVVEETACYLRPGLDA